MSSHDRTVTSSGAAFRLQGGRSRQPPLLATLAERRTGRMTGPQTQSYWHKPVRSRASRHHLGVLVACKPCTHLWEQPCDFSRSRNSRKLLYLKPMFYFLMFYELEMCVIQVAL